MRINIKRKPFVANPPAQSEQTEKVKQKPGPNTVIGGKPMNFLPGDDFRKEMDTFIEEVKNTSGAVLTYSTILRTGGQMFMVDKRKELKLVKKGEFHAKKRVA